MGRRKALAKPICVEPRTSWSWNSGCPTVTGEPGLSLNSECSRFWKGCIVDFSMSGFFCPRGMRNHPTFSWGRGVTFGMAPRSSAPTAASARMVSLMRTHEGRLHHQRLTNRRAMTNMDRRAVNLISLKPCYAAMTIKSCPQRSCPPPRCFLCTGIPRSSISKSLSTKQCRNVRRGLHPDDPWCSLGATTSTSRTAMLLQRRDRSCRRTITTLVL